MSTTGSKSTVMENEVKTEDISAKDRDSKEEAREKSPEPDPTFPFDCSICKLITVASDYFGTRPPFARTLHITEPSYVMKDPFCPPPSSGKPNPEHFLVIGVNCAFCDAQVCKSLDCSFHYSKTFCCKCALENVKQFPLEIQTKIRKQLITNKDK